MDYSQELTKQLEGLKADLQNETKQLTEKAKEDFTKQIKSIEDNLKTIEGKIPTKQVEEINTSIQELKTSTTDIKQIKDWQVKKDEADKLNQEALDNLLAQKKIKTIDEAPVTLQSALSEGLLQGDGYEKLKRMADNKPGHDKRFTVEMKTVGTVSMGNVTGGTNYSTVVRPGIIEAPKRKVHIRDVVPVGNVGPGTQFVFMRQNGAGEGSIIPVAENGTKPQFDLDLVEAAVNIETIAGWMLVTRKAMNNIPGFLSFLQSRLPELFLRAEDYQLIQGDGISPNISGILDSGNYVAATSSAAVLIEQLIDSIAQLEDTEERYATAGLLRPVDYYNFFKNKATGSGEYNLPQNVAFQNGTLYVSGIPFYASTAVPSGTYIVGDFQMGAQLLIQEGMRIEFFEQDDVNVRKNLITVRIEGTECFPIYGNNYFIAGTVPGGS